MWGDGREDDWGREDGCPRVYGKGDWCRSLRLGLLLLDGLEDWGLRGLDVGLREAGTGGRRVRLGGGGARKRIEEAGAVRRDKICAAS